MTRCRLIRSGRACVPVAAWLAICLCAGCGSSAPATRHAQGESTPRGDDHAQVSSSTGAQDAEGVSSGGTEVSSDEASSHAAAENSSETADEPACADLSRSRCASTSGCVFDGICRPPRGECENTRPATSAELSPGQPDFSRGDPCARVNRACAFDRRGFCTDFVAVTSCPASREQAETTPIFCMHPDQPALDCPYDGGWCACHAPPPYCGGMRPSSDILNQPTTWACLDDANVGGCPTRPIRSGARCDLDPARNCIQGCSDILQCVRHQWRVTGRLPPRP